MHQLKTFFLKYKRWTSLDKPMLYIYLQSDAVYVYEFKNDSDGLHVRYQKKFDGKDSILDLISDAIKDYLNTFKLKTKPYLYVILDDYFLFINRVSLNEFQLRDLIHSIEIEIDNLNGYEWSYTKAISDVQTNFVFLVYGIKKSLLKQIETTIRADKFVLRNMMTKYHSFEALIKHNKFKLEVKNVNVVVDIGLTKVRVYFIFKQELRLYRRFNLRLETDKESPDFSDVFKNINLFLDSCISSYLVKFTNHSIAKIFMYSDSYDIPSDLSAYSIQGYSIFPLVMDDTDIRFDETTSLDRPFLLSYGGVLSQKESKPFNLIPFEKRRERLGFISIGCLFLIALIYAVFWGFSTYSLLVTEFSQYEGDFSTQNKERSRRKREIVALRDRISEQQNIINYADLTMQSYSTQLPVSDFLFEVAGIASRDIVFTMISVSNSKVVITGECSAANSNASFYLFIQNLQSVNFVDNIQYSMGLGSSPDKVAFTINVTWGDSNDA